MRKCAQNLGMGLSLVRFFLGGRTEGERLSIGGYRISHVRPNDIIVYFVTSCTSTGTTTCLKIVEKANMNGIVMSTSELCMLVRDQKVSISNSQADQYFLCMLKKIQPISHQH